MLVGELAKADIEKFKEQLIDKGLSKRTVNMHLSELSKILRHCRDFDLIDRMPIIKRFRISQKFTIVRLYDNHLAIVRRFLDANKQYRDVQLWIEIALATAMRPYEICNLDYSHINFETRTIEIDSEDNNKPERIIPLSTRLIEILDRKKSGRVVRYRNTRYAYRAICRALDDISGAIGIRITPKIFRKTSLSIMADRDISRSKVAAIAGHRSEKTTNKYYIKHEVEALRDAVEAL
jgi:integrase